MEENLAQAQSGDISAFNKLFKPFDEALKSYLYRLLTNRQDVEDYYHETFIKAFDKIASFRGDSSKFKSWVFSIATNLCLNYLKRKSRWEVRAQENARDNMEGKTEDERGAFFGQLMQMPYSAYEIKEHIDFCYTCVSQTLPFEQQLTLILKEVYQFRVREIGDICGFTLGQTKHHLLDARNRMKEIYDHKCSLINKTGTCYQCSELQGKLNPKKDKYREVMKIEMARQSEELDRDELYLLRAKLIQQINPLNAQGADFHDGLMQEVKKVSGYLSSTDRS